MDSITFGGTATTLIRLGAFTVLTDPNFLHKGQRAYLGKGLWSRRLTEPAVVPANLPVLDAVVLSHLHGDHFDRVARRELDRAVPLVTTEPAAKRLRKYGFATTGLPVWSSFELTRDDESLTVEALPGTHARGFMRALLPPVMGSMLVHRRQGEVQRRLYISGDTLSGDHLDEIGSRYPDIDAAIVHLGGTRVLFSTVTMDGREGLDCLRRVRPKLTVPVHYDDYGVMKSPLSEFLDEVNRDTEDWQIEAPARGETVELGTRDGRAEGDSVAGRLTGASVDEAGLGLTWWFGCEPATVWAALSRPELLGEWLGPTVLSDTDFGVFSTRCLDDDVERSGTVVTCNPEVSLHVEWSEPGGHPDRIGAKLAPDQRGTLLTLTLQDKSRADAAAYRAVWEQRLERLGRVVGTEALRR
ncbi:Activator of Hsp90 ATPase 1 family protein [Kribbella flavida DSM 17836]|uniref:Activator of Hsp90 ATPase 1 family protein n=1 Tax=Kribbella flavida (strain DSM 17836 / JCM 10339 / NBRC 14399) TaxID=479435 RepID=D2PRS9_KRIFD|nr:MBL fold metallo-hydrolase [Kribbella flavida]ADB29259.1 Activator of Hsp90 ATPase 1 family protein [Kribbella flavida DSM 17836]